MFVPKMVVVMFILFMTIIILKNPPNPTYVSVDDTDIMQNWDHGHIRLHEFE